MTQRDQQRVYEFEGFLLDPWRRLLFGPSGRKIPLKPRVLTTLLYFVEHRGELIDKDRLMRAVWGGVIVEENSINKHVSTLRRALDESPGDHRFLVTIPGKGYRFVAQLRTRPETGARSEPASSDVPQGLLRAEPATATRYVRVRYAGIVMALLAIVALAVWVAQSRESAHLPGSIAVLPFKSLSPNPDDALFAAGVHAEILSTLAKLTDLKVIARTSVLRYADGKKTVPEIARELNVETVMEGSIRYGDGGGLRVTAALVDAATGVGIWTQTYEERLGDIFAIESDIASKVATAMKGQLSTVERQRLTVEKTSPDIQRLMVRARVIVEAQSAAVQAQLPELREELEQAIKEYPDYFPLRFMLVRVCSTMLYLSDKTQLHPRFDPEVLLRLPQLMTETANDAHARWPSRPEAIALHGHVAATVNNDYETGVRELQQALALSPRDLTVLRLATDVALRLGRPAFGLEIQEYVLSRDPVCTECRNVLMEGYLEAERFASVKRVYEEARDLGLELGQDGCLRYGLALAMSGEVESAKSLSQECGFGEVVRLIWTSLALYNSHRTGSFDATFAELRATINNDPRILSILYVWLNDLDTAFDMMMDLPTLDPKLFYGQILVRTKMRRYPRWPELAAKAGIPAEDPRDRPLFDIALPNG